MRRSALPAVAVAALLLAACGSDPTSKPDEPVAPTAGPPRWVSVPGMACADGSGTGIGVSPGTASGVLLVLSGGGACWSDGCPADVPRSFDPNDYLFGAVAARGPIVDRTLPGNPFATWTHVFVPYCTGDVHAGDAEGDWVQQTATTAKHWLHRGAANLRAAVGAMKAEVARPARVVVSGSSAGGFGALLALDLVHAAWDAAGPGSIAVSLVDDSGPTFVGTAMPPALLTAWWDAWHLASTVDPGCPTCRTDLSGFWGALHQRHPQDRLALLSTTQDSTMRGFFVDPANGNAPMSAGAFETDLAALCRTLGGGGNAFDGKAACFRTAGTGHAMLLAPATYQPSAGDGLLAWLTRLVSGDVGWAPTGP